MTTTSLISHADFIRTETELMATPLVPELRLHLAEDPRGIFDRADLHVDSGLGARPYWAFAWPGGQALARYLIDNPQRVAGRSVLDLGSGSGIGAIAALKAGASSALAADIDPIADVAARLNAEANGVVLETTTEDLLAAPIRWQVILIGDLVYEPDLKLRVGRFLETARKAGATVLYADRTSARRPDVDLVLLKEYEAPMVPPLVEDFIERARVWELASKR